MGAQLWLQVLSPALCSRNALKWEPAPAEHLLGLQETLAKEQGQGCSALPQDTWQPACVSWVTIQDVIKGSITIC